MPKKQMQGRQIFQLQKYLKEDFNITLIIKSQKTKPNGHEEDNL